MSAISVDTGRQTTPPLVDGVVHTGNRLQLVDVLDSAIVHTLHALLCTFFSSVGSAKIIKIY